MLAHMHTDTHTVPPGEQPSMYSPGNPTEYSGMCNTDTNTQNPGQVILTASDSWRRKLGEAEGEQGVTARVLGLGAHCINTSLEPLPTRGVLRQSTSPRLHQPCSVHKGTG